MHVFLFWVPPPPGRGKLLWLASLACLKVGKSAGHQLASPADVPTQVSQSASNPNRLVISRQMFGDSQLLRIQFSLCVSVRPGPSLVVDFSCFRLSFLLLFLFFPLQVVWFAGLHFSFSPGCLLQLALHGQIILLYMHCISVVAVCDHSSSRARLSRR